MSNSTAENYYELWDKRPSCLSEQDIFEKNKEVKKETSQEITTPSTGIKTTLFALGAFNFSTLKKIVNNTKTKKEEEKVEAKPEEVKRKDSTKRKAYNFEVHGLKLKLATTSCLLISDKTCLRFILVWIIYWKYTDFLIYFSIVVNSIFLSLFDYTQSADATRLNTIVILYHCHNMTICFQLLFLVEAGIKVFGVGLAFADETYLRDPWNRLDAIVVISIVICFVLGSPLNFTMFRLLRLLHIIQQTRFSIIMRQIVLSFLKSVYQILFIFALLFVFVIMFSLIGVAMFAGATHYYCRVTPEPIGNVWNIPINDTVPCGVSHQCNIYEVCGSLYELRGIPDNQTIEINYGITNYDNFLNSLATTFQVSTIEGWANLMYSIGNTTLFRAPSASPSMVKHSTTFRNLRKSILGSFSLVNTEAAYSNSETWRDKLQLILNTPIFNTLISLMILANDIIMATDTYENNLSSHLMLLEVSYYVFLTAFSIEIALRIFANRSYLLDLINMCDFLIIISSLLDVIINQRRGCLLALRTFKIFTTVKFGKKLRRIVSIIGKAAVALCLHMIIVFIFIYIHAILGMELFAGKLRFTSDYQVDLKNGYLITFNLHRTVPRSNYDSLFWALFTSFQGFVGDQWYDTMHLAVIACGWDYALFYYSLILFGKVTLYSMYISVLLSVFMAEKMSIPEDQENRRRSVLPSESRFSPVGNRKILPINKLETIMLPTVIRRNQAPPSEEDKNSEKDQAVPSRKSSEAVSVIKTHLQNSRKNSEAASQHPSKRDSKASPSQSRRVSQLSQNPSRRASNDANQKEANNGGEFSLNAMLKKAVFAATKLESEQKINVDENKKPEEAEPEPEPEQEAKPEPISMQQPEKEPEPEPEPEIEPKIEELKDKELQVKIPQEQNASLDSKSSQNSKGEQEGNSQNKVVIMPEGTQEAGGFSQKAIGTDGELDTNNQAVVKDPIYNENEDSEEESLFEKCVGFLRVRSLFIFHKDWQLRLFLAEWLKPFDEEIYYSNNEYREDVEYTDALERLKTTSKARATIHEMILTESMSLKRRWKSNIFESIILVLILFSILILIIDDPSKNPQTPLRQFCEQCNIFFTCAFALEAFLKIIAMDFIWPSEHEGQAYLSSGWNILDFTVTITSILNLSNFAQLGILKSLKVLRALRLLRPMKMMQSNEQLRLMVHTLINVVPDFARLCVVIFFYVFTFGIIMTFYFKGSIKGCASSSDNGCPNHVGPLRDEIGSFDNIGQAMITLLQTMLKNGWSRVAYIQIDSVGFEREPERDHAPAWGLFVIAYMLFGYFLFIQMFLCSLFDCFYTTKLEFCGALSCSFDEQQWINIQRFMLRRNLKIQPTIPKDGIRLKCYEISQTKGFEIFNIIVMCFGAFLYCCKYYMMPRQYEYPLTILTYMCMFEMDIYCGIKFVGGGQSYLRERWNVWDLFLMVLGNVGAFLEIGKVTPIAFAVATALRPAKLLKLLRSLKISKLTVIADSIIFILPSLLNVSIVVFLLLLIYATLGMYLFWGVKNQGSITENVNFRSFGNALLLVLSCSTGDGWNSIMQSLARIDSTCVATQTFEDIEKNGIQGCGTVLAYPYFITFIVFVCLMGIKLFTVVVVEGYMEAVNENYSIITAKQFETFIEEWSKYDPQGTGWISVEGLIYLFFSLEPPLGVYGEKVRLRLWDNYLETNKKKGKPVVQKRLFKRLVSQIDINKEFFLHKSDKLVFERRKIWKMLKELDIPLEVDTWRIHYRDVCQSMSVRAIMRKKNINFEVKEKKARVFFKQKWLLKFPEKRRRQYLNEVCAKDYWLAHFVWKIFKLRLERKKEQIAKRAQLSIAITNELAEFKRLSVGKDGKRP